MSKLTDCGRSYEIQMVEKKWGPPAAWTVKGIVVHDVLDLWEKKERAPDFDWDTAFREAWDLELEKQKRKWPNLSDWTRTPRTKSTENDLEYRHRDGLVEVEKYIDWAISEEDLWSPFILDGKPAVEIPFEVQLPGLDFTIKGYIDKINIWNNGMIAVDDMKTGSDRRQNWRQLALYAVAARQQYGIGVTHGRYVYTKLGRCSEWKDLSLYTPEYLAQEYQKLDQIINNKLFLANPSLDGCTFCGVKQYCKENPYV